MDFDRPSAIPSADARPLNAKVYRESSSNLPVTSSSNRCASFPFCRAAMPLPATFDKVRSLPSALLKETNALLAEMAIAFPGCKSSLLTMVLIFVAVLP